MDPGLPVRKGVGGGLPGHFQRGKRSGEICVVVRLAQTIGHAAVPRMPGFGLLAYLFIRQQPISPPSGDSGAIRDRGGGPLGRHSSRARNPAPPSLWE